MTVPKNILRFEVLLYLSIMIDLPLSVFLHREQLTTLSAGAAASVSLVVMIGLAAICSLVHLAARKRKNWARWVLLCVQTLSAFSSLQAHGFSEFTTIDLSTTVLAFVGLYFSFTGDARGWFNR